MTSNVDVSAEVEIRSAVDTDADALVRIYNHYIMHTVITFEEQPLTAADMAARVHRVQQLEALPWLTAAHGDTVIGYAYATRWRERSAYRLSTEITVYLEPGCEHRGTGTRLYRHLLAGLRECGMHAVVGGIALPNAASVALHEKFGFEQVAQLREIGFKFGRWVDVGYWQKIL
ncbi:MAG: arsinothricin resistance N-acetyltransferase ArsN1 family B [Steroidobacteraceae bacterium]